MRGTGRRSLALVLLLALGCAVRAAPADPDRRSFRFPADAFAFANVTTWEYDIDRAKGSVSWRPRVPRPEFSLRCGTMARAARQFFTSARFDPAAPKADGRAYEALVRELLATDPRRPAADRVVIPGYRDLQQFSAAHEPLLKAVLAGAWQSYLQRGNWRMIFPFPARHQQRLAHHLVSTLASGGVPIVHVLRYPELTINHLVLVYGAEETPAEIRFAVYDPNDAARPVLLTYDRAGRFFSFSATPYFPGGPLKAYEVYDGLLY